MSAPPGLPALPATPRVSCIVTAYNYAEYLPAAIESALAQDYPADRLEIVVVDDGSTDDTPAVVASFAGRVRSIRRENGGLNAATTTGMQAATGRLLTFLDADDVWRPDRTRLLVDALRAAPRAAIAYGDMEIVDAAGAPLAASFRAETGLTAHSGQVFDRLFANNFISAGSMMVRAEPAPSFCPIPAFAAHQDWWIASQVARVAEVVAIAQPVNCYRHHGANMNLGVEGDRRTALWAAELSFRRWLLQTADPALVGVRALRTALSTLDGMIEHVARARGLAQAELLGLGGEDRARALAALHAASHALDGGRLASALALLFASIGHDPLWSQPRVLAAELAPIVEQRAAEAVVHAVRRRPPTAGRVRDVVIAVDYFHPSVGGSERLAEGLGVALARRGLRVTVATRALPERRARTHRGLAIHDVAQLPGDLQRALDRADALIALSDPRAWPLAAWPALAELPRRVVAVPCINAENHAHLTADHEALARYRASMRLADVVVHSSLGGLDADLVARLGQTGAYVPNAVDPVRPGRGLRARLGIDDDAVLVLAVGNLWPEKNHLGLLDALDPLPDGWHLVVAGAPAPAHPDLAERIAARAARLARAHLVGALAADEVAAAMVEATAFVLPSLAEATPLVLIEAMSHGLPWLAAPGCGSARDHAGGIVLPVDGFRAAIERLAGDGAARAALGDAGRRHWQAAYCWDAVAPRYVALLEGDDPGPLVAPADALATTAALAAELTAAAAVA